MSDKTPELSSLPPQPDLTEQDPSSKLKRELEERLDVLPAETQLIVLRLASGFAGDIIAQSTNEHGALRPNNDFYSRRIDEIKDSGLLNPHTYPSKKIT